MTNYTELECYDAGLLGDGGGGDVDWWQDYIRSELARAHEFYNDQHSTLERENRELREALEPFALASEAIGSAWGPDLPLTACAGFVGNILMVRDLRHADATLKGSEV